MADKVQVQGGMGLFGWLTVAFVVLKLTGFIDWSWWLVLAPLWAGLAIWAVIIVAAIVVVALRGD